MPVVDGLEQEYAGRLQVVRLNFNEERNKAALRALHVQFHPTVVLLDRKGVAQDPLIGVQSEEKLRPKLDALLAQ